MLHVGLGGFKRNKHIAENEIIEVWNHSDISMNSDV
jgi:hypothetical protein